jgi:hypothetical protein
MSKFCAVQIFIGKFVSNYQRESRQTKTRTKQRKSLEIIQIFCMEAFDDSDAIYVFINHSAYNNWAKKH